MAHDSEFCVLCLSGDPNHIALVNHAVHGQSVEEIPKTKAPMGIDVPMQIVAYFHIDCKKPHRNLSEIRICAGGWVHQWDVRRVVYRRQDD